MRSAVRTDDTGLLLFAGRVLVTMRRSGYTEREVEEFRQEALGRGLAEMIRIAGRYVEVVDGGC